MDSENTCLMPSRAMTPSDAASLFGVLSKVGELGKNSMARCCVMSAFGFSAARIAQETGLGERQVYRIRSNNKEVIRLFSNLLGPALRLHAGSRLGYLFHLFTERVSTLLPEQIENMEAKDIPKMAKTLESLTELSDRLTAAVARCAPPPTRSPGTPDDSGDSYSSEAVSRGVDALRALDADQVDDGDLIDSFLEEGTDEKEDTDAEAQGEDGAVDVESEGHVTPPAP